MYRERFIFFLVLLNILNVSALDFNENFGTNSSFFATCNSNSVLNSSNKIYDFQNENWYCIGTGSWSSSPVNNTNIGLRSFYPGSNAFANRTLIYQFDNVVSFLDDHFIQYYSGGLNPTTGPKGKSGFVFYDENFNHKLTLFTHNNTVVSECGCGNGYPTTNCFQWLLSEDNNAGSLGFINKTFQELKSETGVTDSHLSGIKYFGITACQETGVASGNIATYYDDFHMTTVEIENNQLPNFTVVYDKIVYVNESFVESTGDYLNIQIEAVDPEGDIIYYSVKERYFDNSPFLVGFGSDPNNCDLILINEVKNQYGFFTNDSYTPNNLVQNYLEDCKLALEDEIKFRNTHLNTFEHYLFTVSFVTDNSDLTVSFLDFYQNEISSFTLDVIGSNVSLVNSSLHYQNYSRFNEDTGFYSELKFIITDFNDGICGIYSCNQDVCQIDEYTFNFNISCETDVVWDYISFNPSNTTLFDNFIINVPEFSFPTDWSTTPPNQVFYNYEGLHQFKIFVTDSPHISTEYVTDQFVFNVYKIENAEENVNEIQSSSALGAIKAMRVGKSLFLGREETIFYPAMWLLQAVFFVAMLFVFRRSPLVGFVLHCIGFAILGYMEFTSSIQFGMNLVVLGFLSGTAFVRGVFG